MFKFDVSNHSSKPPGFGVTQIKESILDKKEPVATSTNVTSNNEFKKNSKITVCFISDKTITVNEDLNIINLKTDETLYDVIQKYNPHVFVTFGNWTSYKTLCNVPYDIRKKWINLKPDVTEKTIIEEIFNCYNYNILETKSEYPLISVFTCAYNTNQKIFRPYNSLFAQTYKNWEWIVLDDSDDNKTYELLKTISKIDNRVKVFKPNEHVGSLGQVKKWAAGLCNGEILVELDHDDELTNKALDYINKAFKKHEDVGFLYSNFSDIYEEDNESVLYQQKWGIGFGDVKKELYKNINYNVNISPSINCATIRHISSTPNHVRAWRRNVYHKIGGHNPNLFICDDYELFIKTFLTTKIAHLNKFCYIQYRSENRTNDGMLRNKETIRHFNILLSLYNDEINKRFEQLNIPDLFKDKKVTEDSIKTTSVNNIINCSLQINDL